MVKLFLFFLDRAIADVQRELGYVVETDRIISKQAWLNNIFRAEPLFQTGFSCKFFNITPTCFTSFFTARR